MVDMLTPRNRCIWVLLGFVALTACGRISADSYGRAVASTGDVSQSMMPAPQLSNAAPEHYSVLTQQQKDGLSAASNLRVLSQLLVIHSRDAANGSAQAFMALRTTKAEIDAALRNLNSDYGADARLAEPIRNLNNTWKSLANHTNNLLFYQQAVLGLTDHANRFDSKTRQFQAQLREVLRGMASGGTTTSQLFEGFYLLTAATDLDRNIVALRKGGDDTQIAIDALSRNTAIINRMLGILQNGNAEFPRVTAAGAIAPLNQSITLWQTLRMDIDAIQGYSEQLKSAQESAEMLNTDSDKLLSDSSRLFGEILESTSSGSLPQQGRLQ